MSAIQSHGVVKSTADETYGSGRLILRIGNGGAGALGLVGALARDYLTELDREASITWVCNHSRNTQLALMEGYLDLALTYERNQEKISIDEGWAASGGCVFHDHFCLAGPIDDPAGVKGADDIHDAFKRIALSQSIFLCRADSSATMIKERSIWTSIDMDPWNGDHPWYLQTLFSPGEAVAAASSKHAYLLTDRSTLLSQTSNGMVLSMTVFFEPENPDSILMNSCFALYNPGVPSEVQKEVDAFLKYVKSSRGQKVVAEYGHSVVSVPFFAPVAAGYARDSIVGGSPVNRRWAWGPQA